MVALVLTDFIFYFIFISSSPLPAPNQDCAASDVGFSDEVLRVKLEPYHLGLNAHPRLLVCTRGGCTHGVILLPKMKNIVSHLKEHSQALPPSREADLKGLLENLHLDNPSKVIIRSDLLPAPMIKGVDVFRQGHRCLFIGCSYAIKSRSTMYDHIKMHQKRGEKSPESRDFEAPVAIQMIDAASRRWLYIRDTELDPTPPQPLPAEAVPDRSALNDAAKAKVKAILAHNETIKSELPPDVLPARLRGNISPWASQLGWVDYWEGKSVAAIGALGRDPTKWPGAYSAFNAWLMSNAKEAACSWMEGLCSAPSRIQQTFHAYSDQPSRPYSVTGPTITKRANLWAYALALLSHLVLDEEQSYFGKGTKEDHLFLDEDCKETLFLLRDAFGTEEESSHGQKFFQGEGKKEYVQRQLLALSYGLVTQVPDHLGDTAQLTLARLFMHLCVSSDGTLKMVNAATSDLVSLEFGLRAVMHKALLDSEERSPLLEIGEGSLREVPSQELYSRLEATLKRYTYHSSLSASGWFQSLLPFGATLAQDDGSSLRCAWAKDLSSISCGAVSLPIDRLQSMLHAVQRDAEKLLRHLCLFPKEMVIAINLKNLKDQHTKTVPGYNFAKDSFDEEVENSILYRAAAGNTLGEESIALMDPLYEEGEFDHGAAESYFAMHDRFVLLLAVLVQLSSGLPARGSELGLLQHTNTLAGPRNIFVHSGSVFTALPSSKGKGAQKVVPRFLPHAVGCLVVYYVAQVVPFVHVLYNQVKGAREFSPYLLARHTGQPYDTQSISGELQRLALNHIGSHAKGLSLRTWRQLAVSIDRKLIRPKKPSAHLEEVADSAHDLQAGHTTAIAEQHYGLDVSMLRRLTPESMDAMLAVSERWHAFWDMASRFGEDATPYHQLAEGTIGSDPSAALNDLKRKMDSMHEELRCIKRRLESSEPAAAPSELESKATCISYRSPVLPLEVSKALFKVTKSWTTSSLDQAYALNAVHAREDSLIIVMGTGSGKSALFMAPLLWLPVASVIIVLVPFIALAEDLARQCTGLGINSTKWFSDRDPDIIRQSEIIFVAVEHCCNESFVTYTRSLVQQGRLAAIFFDECHVCMTQSDFRPSMKDIRQFLAVFQAQAPQYFLTATLPPSLESEFKATLGLSDKSSRLLRTTTNRKNISYAVECLDSNKDIQARALNLLRAYPTGAVMIFFKSKDEAWDMSQKIGCSLLHSDLPEWKKNPTLTSWLQCSADEKEDKKRVIVGTSAIGTGINPQHVRLVVHCDGAWDMVSYLQESGRGGRKGQDAKAVLLTKSSSRLQEQVQDYAEEKRCRRLAISSYIDGVPVTCLSQPGFALCDLCEMQAGVPPIQPQQLAAPEWTLDSESELGPLAPDSNSIDVDNNDHANYLPESVVFASTLSSWSTTPNDTSKACTLSGMSLHQQQERSAIPSPPSSDCDSSLPLVLKVARPSRNHADSMPRPGVASTSATPSLASKSTSYAGTSSGMFRQKPSTLPSSSSSNSGSALPLARHAAKRPSQGFPYFQALAEPLRGSCSMCYFFQHQHTCKGQHTFHNCSCWGQLSSIIKGKVRLNGGSIGLLKSRDMAKNVGCYGCFFPMKMCKGNDDKHCSNKYRDMVLPITEAILRDDQRRTEISKRINKPLHFDIQKLGTNQINLGDTVICKGERVLLGFAIFIAAMEMYGPGLSVPA